jgi:hypothetical protein
MCAQMRLSAPLHLDHAEPNSGTVRRRRFTVTFAQAVRFPKPSLVQEMS